jgi:EAL domain-containing protein (putative c-di-GMP-specific phosphodiesterase class I)
VSVTSAPAIFEPDLGAFERGLLTVLAEPERIGLVFQPIVDLAHAVVTGYEGLARFYVQPRATPDRWFAAAEELGLAAELEARVIERMLKMRALLPPNCFLSINLGPNAAGSEAVQQAFASAGELGDVVIEITEQVAVHDYGLLSDALAPLRSAGAALAINGAGAGFARISALRPDFVKVDRGLVAELDTDPAKATIIEMLGTAAGHLGAWLIAEGVERDSELLRLMQLGVPLAQGYRLARPSPVMDGLDADVEELLANAQTQEHRGGAWALHEPCPSIEVGAPRAAIAELFFADPRTTLVTLVDRDERPVSIVSRRGFITDQAPSPVSMTVGTRSDIAEIARRAITRPNELRFDPLVCCDERGRLVGIVRIERLIEALAR